MSSTEQLKSVLKQVKATGKIDADSLKELSFEEKQLVHELYNDDLIADALLFIDELDTDQEWNLLKEKAVYSKKRVVPLWKSAMRYAAIFMGLLAVIYFFRTEKESVRDAQISEGTIKLKTGVDVKVIREGESQQIVSASGKVIGKQNGNRIRYDADAEIDELIYNELEIPYGKIFDVELSDGTVVHLNSGTKMRYPVKFLKGLKREVFIEGEAYFNVTKDEEHPFVVNADDVVVEVLGTEFNVSSYKEDQEIRTVLVEGSVRMTNSVASESNVVLRPGEKGAWNRLARVTEVEEVDVELYTGWIKGELIFRNSTFEDMAKKLERRYMVTIQNNNLLLANKMLNARFNVNIESIDDVLQSISEIQQFEYRIIDQKIEIH